MYAKRIEDCTDQELYYALLAFTKQQSEAKYTNDQKKKVYYISAEFLIGKLLSNNLINLGLYNEVKSQLVAAGKDLITIEDMEEADKIFEVLMGSDVPPRKKFIQTHSQEADLDI